MLKSSRTVVKEESIQASLADFVIPATIIDFPKMDKVPSGYYFSEIIDIQPRVTNSGKKCIDVVYDLQGFHDKLGDHVIRLSYPLNSQPLQELYKAMLKAGVSPGPNMQDAIGVTEKIHLVYDDEDGIGRIHKRVYDPPQEDDTSEEDGGEESAAEEDEE